MIANWDDMLEEHLRVYQSYNKGALSEQIIIYHDGVSGGQYFEIIA